MGDLLKDFWRGRKFVVSGVLLCLFAALVFSMMAVPHYQARLLVAPSMLMDTVSAGAQARDKASQARDSQTQQGQALFTRFMASYQGATVARLMLADEFIRAGLSKDKNFRGVSAKPADNAAELARYINKRVSVDQIGETELRELTYSHPDAKFAALFLSRLHELTDGLIRYSMRRELSGRIEYLNTAMDEALNLDHRRALADLLTEQERTKMLISIDQPYAAAVLEPAYTQAGVFWPNAMLVWMGFGLVGAAIGYIVFQIIESAKPRSQARSSYQEQKAQSYKRKLRDWVRFNNGNDEGAPRKFSSNDIAAE